MKGYVRRYGKKFFEAFTRLSPLLSAKVLYFIRLRRIPNLKHPRSFAEKLTWLKLNTYAQDPLVSKLADKYAVREYVEERGYGRILNELYGVYTQTSDIDFDSLPSRFALKGTHGCAYNLIVGDKSKLDYEHVRKTADSWLGDRYGYASTELHYTKIQPRVIAEKNLANEIGELPMEYKIFCFDGKVNVIQVSPDPENPILRNYFDTDWNELMYSKDSFRCQNPIEQPSRLGDLVAIAEDLAGNFPFVRVDLYADDHSIIFGELTFSPAAGCPPILSAIGQNEMGAMMSDVASEARL